MRRLRDRTAVIAVLFPCLLVLGACSAPSAPRAIGAPNPNPTLSQSQAAFAGNAARLGPDHFAAQGWECRPVPFTTNQVGCTPPHQGFPPHPPTPDRPPTFTIMIWEDGTFLGTMHLIRDDLYQDQSCEPAGGPYSYRQPIGYYACLRTVGDGSR